MVTAHQPIRMDLTSKIPQDLVAFLSASTIMVVTVEVVHYLGRRNPNLSRKILHIGELATCIVGRD